VQNPVVYVYIFMFSMTGYFGVNVVLNLVKIYGALIAVTGMACYSSASCDHFKYLILTLRCKCNSLHLWNRVDYSAHIITRFICLCILLVCKYFSLLTNLTWTVYNRLHATHIDVPMLISVLSNFILCCIFIGQVLLPYISKFFLTHDVCTFPFSLFQGKSCKNS